MEMKIDRQITVTISLDELEAKDLKKLLRRLECRTGIIGQSEISLREKSLLSLLLMQFNNREI